MKEQDGAVVTCSVAGGGSATARLEVSHLPVVEVEGVGREAGLVMGGRARLTCRAEAKPEVLRWGWRLGTEEVQSEGDTMVLDKLGEELQGAEVHCWAENLLGRGENSGELFIRGQFIFIL